MQFRRTSFSEPQKCTDTSEGAEVADEAHHAANKAPADGDEGDPQARSGSLHHDVAIRGGGTQFTLQATSQDKLPPWDLRRHIAGKENCDSNL